MKYLLLLPLILGACAHKVPQTTLCLNTPWEDNSGDGDYEFFHPPIYEPHPRSPEEIQEENDDEQYRYKREVLDILDPEGAPHSTEDAKNLA